MSENLLYYGDNLDILRRYVDDESVDLIYLDPPFNSNATYNVLFAEHDTSRAAAQIKAFEDTWHWDRNAEEAYEEIVEQGGTVSEAMQAFRMLLGAGDMMAYLAMMAPRLVELRRVLTDKGSIYLHCDPTASHYLKILMDAVFGPKLFRNEIVWKRSSAHSDTKQGMRRYGKIRDVLLFYTKSLEYAWEPQYTPYTKDYLEGEYRHTTAAGRYYKETDLTAAKPGGDTDYAWHVKRPRGSGARWEADLEDEFLDPKADWEYQEVRPYRGRYWAYSKSNLIGFAQQGHLIHRETGMPRLMQFADEMLGISLQDLWTDIPPASGGEDLGYPTQKPLALLERILKASSQAGDTVLDPFCGCGTTIAAAQKLNRRWIGIDVTHIAVNLIRTRLLDMYGELAKFRVIGEPTSVPDAQELAASDPYQFQWWALGLVGARPVEQKKGADHGIDGRIYFHDGVVKAQQVILSVKAGHTNVSHVRDLRGVLDREKAAIGVLISMEKPTGPMRTEAASAGSFESSLMGKRYPRMQLLTIEDLLASKSIEMPPLRQVSTTFRRAPKGQLDEQKHQAGLFEDVGA